MLNSCLFIAYRKFQVVLLYSHIYWCMLNWPIIITWEIYKFNIFRFNCNHVGKKRLRHPWHLILDDDGGDKFRNVVRLSNDSPENSFLLLRKFDLKIRKAIAKNTERRNIKNAFDAFCYIGRMKNNDQYILSSIVPVSCIELRLQKSSQTVQNGVQAYM